MSAQPTEKLPMVASLHVSAPLRMVRGSIYGTTNTHE